MDTVKMSYFLSVANTLSFTKTADDLYKTQSVISRQISSLEEDLGVKLFERSTRGVALTPAGVVCRDGFQKILNDYTAVLGRARAVQDGYEGELNICVATGQMLFETLAPILRQFEQSYPQIIIHLTAENPSSSRRKLVSGQVDFVFARKGEYRFYSNIDAITIALLRNCIVVPTTHPKAGCDPNNLTMADFKDDTFLVLSEIEIPSHKKAIETGAAAAGFIPKMLEVRDFSTLGVLLETQRGITMTNEMHMLRTNPFLEFLPLPSLPITESSIQWNSDNLTASSEIFICFVQQYILKHPIQDPKERLWG